MNTFNFQEETDKFLESTLSTMFEKGRDYASVNNFFSNFEQATGISFCDTREGVLWHYLTKHLQSIKDMVNVLEVGGKNHGHFTKAKVDEKIGDAINYLLILRGMLTERVNDYNNSKEYDGRNF